MIIFINYFKKVFVSNFNKVKNEFNLKKKIMFSFPFTFLYKIISKISTAFVYKTLLLVSLKSGQQEDFFLMLS